MVSCAQFFESGVQNAVVLIPFWTSFSTLDYGFVSATLTILASLLVGFLSLVLWKQFYEGMKDPESTRPLPPGNMGLPFVGESIFFLRKGANFFVDKFIQHGPVYKTHLFGTPTIRLSGADNIVPLANKEPNYISVSHPKSARAAFGPNSLVTQSGGEHSKLKKKLLTSFTPVRLADYLPCIQEQIKSHILSWSKQGQILGFPACEELMCDIMLEVVLGWRKENDPQGVVRQAFKTVNESLIAVPINVPGFGFYKAVKARKIIEEFVKKRLSTESDQDHVCMLDVLLVGHGEQADGEKGRLTEEQIIDNAVTLLLAGSGTTSGALTCLLLMLGKNTDVLAKLERELDANGLLNSEDNEPLSYQLLQSLEYTQWVIKEVLRMHPPVGGVFRKADKTLEVNNYQIPKNWNMIYSIRETHHYSPVFKDRDEFVPERWNDQHLEERLHSEDTGNYMPFGFGARMCLGKSLAQMEMGIFLVELCRLVKWKLHNPNASMVFLPSTKPKDDLPVTFSRKD